MTDKLEDEIVNQTQESIAPSNLSEQHQVDENGKQNPKKSCANEGNIKTIKRLGTLEVVKHSTPRIDISRASSSSHHDSRESSPENVFDQVGTGTLQDAIVMGFQEEGALDLRSSTEELYFMEPEEREKSQKAQKSPIILQQDERNFFLQQHKRKNSTNSEIAALISISGRSSRISSVGSHCSAVSKLSALSNASRSPSPHKMLLETSFCGPKPLEDTIQSIEKQQSPIVETLEQIILSRKIDPTQAVLAEGISIEAPFNPTNVITPTSSIKRSSATVTKKEETITKITTPLQTSKPSVLITKTATTESDNLKKTRKRTGKQVVGVTPSGTEYIRINLKPDHMYKDHGVAPNERLVDKEQSNINEKPKKNDKKQAAIEHHSENKSASSIIHSHDLTSSRSPSPAASVIRKNSFCSLFKSKDTLDSPRDQSRSRTKSHDRSASQTQANTPNKQSTVLTIFKTRKTSEPSKSSSPIGHENLSQFEGVSQVEFKFKSDVDSKTTQPSKPRLKYYDAPTDGNGILIFLHTPPDENKSIAISLQNDSKENNTSSPSAALDKPTSAASSIQKQSDEVPSLPPKAIKSNILEQKSQNVVPLDTISSDTAEKLHKQEIKPAPKEIGLSKNETSIECENTKTLPNQTSVEVHQSLGIIKQQQVPTTKEKRRLLFATKIGSGSEEQIFSTQFSISKTESMCSQLSEQTIPESPSVDNKDTVRRIETVKRRNGESKTKVDNNTPDIVSFTLDKNKQHNDKQIKLEQKLKETTLYNTQSVGNTLQKQETQNTPRLSSYSFTVHQMANDKIESSESEKDADADKSQETMKIPRNMGTIEDESTGLVSQESFEDELPYVPTTLPEERTHGVSIIPMKDRAKLELKTCPVNRPRSAKPLNPTRLDKFSGILGCDDTENTPYRGEKLRISLPRRTSNKDIGDQLIDKCTVSDEKRGSIVNENPPPLPPKKCTSNLSENQWINFDNIPEQKKPPKRITIIPKDSTTSTNPVAIQYNYVKPEECQCECHEIERELAAKKTTSSAKTLQNDKDTKSNASEISSIDAHCLKEAELENSENKLNTTEDPYSTRPESSKTNNI